MTSTPDRLALLHEARSEARSDLGRLFLHFDAERAASDDDAAVAEVVQGLLDEPSWDRLNLASVLGEALSLLAKAVASTTDEETP